MFFEDVKRLDCVYLQMDYFGGRILRFPRISLEDIKKFLLVKRYLILEIMFQIFLFLTNGLFCVN